MCNMIQTKNILGVMVMLFHAVLFSCSADAPQGDPASGSDADVPQAIKDKLPQPAVDAPAEESGEAVAVFGGGCFWCTEAIFEQLPGVMDVVSGYAGDDAQSARYDIVSTGRTDHAESVKITYDPSKISYGTLMRIFFATHDPTTLNRQGADVGPQYRSVVFYADQQQKRAAEAYIAQLNDGGHFDDPIVTTVEPLTAFFEAEGYHQDFASQNPGHGYIQHWLPSKQKKLEKYLPEIESQ